MQLLERMRQVREWAPRRASERAREPASSMELNGSSSSLSVSPHHRPPSFRGAPHHRPSAGGGPSGGGPSWLSGLFAAASSSGKCAGECAGVGVAVSEGEAGVSIDVSQRRRPPPGRQRCSTVVLSSDCSVLTMAAKPSSPQALCVSCMPFSTLPRLRQISSHCATLILQQARSSLAASSTSTPSGFRGGSIWSSEPSSGVMWWV
mmetsp:Transcript_4569/g.11095  ORF Transcript_4569/g.11095 Transcript_4569/m.11095 type:complete len:205 (-) Transcript_4569:237-851(-)